MLAIALQLAVLMALDTAPYSTRVFVFVSAVLAAISVILSVPRFARRCAWELDFSGIRSPSIGRIEFVDVVGLHIGYPQRQASRSRIIRAVLRSVFRVVPPDGEVRILRMADGRLFPLDIASPAISSHSEFVGKLTELLVGKLRPNSEFMEADISLLLDRPANKFVGAPSSR